MATWIAHLRIAENLLGDLKNIDKIPFVAGNIAPDAGMPNEDWSSFNPPPAITHWRNEDKLIDADGFFIKYVRSERASENREFYSFVLGYYLHLLADIEWEKMFIVKREEPLYKDNLAKDPKFIWRIKEDWYGQDFVFLKENRDCLFFSCFQYIAEVKDYLDYFPKGAFTNRFRYIREMYQKNYENPKEEFIYFSTREMDEFVRNATIHMKEILHERDCQVFA